MTSIAEHEARSPASKPRRPGPRASLATRLTSCRAWSSAGTSGLVSDSLIKELKDRYTQLSKQKHNKRKYRDSLNRELNFKILHVQYSVQRTIKTSRIRTITVINHYRPEKRKLIKAANVAAALFIAATLISADTQNPYIIGAGVGLTAISFIAKSIITSEDLDLIVSKKAKRKTKWKIAKVIRKS